MACRGNARVRRARGRVSAVLALLLVTATGTAAHASTSGPATGSGAQQGVALALVVARDVSGPAIVSVVPAGSDGLTVTWRATTDALSFRVSAAITDDLTPVATVDAGAEETTATLTGLHVSPGQPVRVWVEADTGGRLVSSVVQAAQLAPAAIDTVQVSRITTTGATVRWTRTEHATAYEVQMSTDPTFGTAATTRRVEGYELVATRLAPTTRQYVHVRPTNGPLAGPWSSTIAFATGPTTDRGGVPPTTTAAAAPAAVPTSAATRLRLGTWNVCSQACPGYAPRARLAAQRLAAAEVDVFVLQEAGGKKVAPVTDAIFGQGTNGYVRANGGDKRGFVFYKAARYAQGPGGHVDLGDDRHMSWARLTDRATGVSFVVAGIHLESGRDRVDPKRAAEMRVALRALAQVSGGLPTVLAGDFNTGPHRGKDTPSTLMAASGLLDARTRSVTPPVGADFNTAHSWDPADLSRHGDHIDRIMTTSQFGVDGWRQLLNLTGDRYTTPMVSDHNAITADLTLRTR